MKKVIYIDDEIFSPKMDSKIEIISDEIGVEIIRIDSVENVLVNINEHIKETALIVLDIIMPYEDVYSADETNGGTTTGLRLLEDIRHKFPNIPIILISIKRKHNLENIDNIISKYQVSEFVEKQAVSAVDISNIIKRFLNEK